MTITTTTMPVATTGLAIPNVLKAAMLFASPDKARPQLALVRFEHNEGYLRLVATDSHKLCVLDTLIDIAEFEPFSVRTDDLTNAIKVMGAKAATYALVIHGEQRQVEFIGNGSITMPQAEVDFPNWQQLMPTNIVDGHAHAFSPHHMIGICKAVQALDPKGAQPVRYVGAESNLKPQLFRAIAQDVGVLDVILMPVRVP